MNDIQYELEEIEFEIEVENEVDQAILDGLRTLARNQIAIAEILFARFTSIDEQLHAMQSNPAVDGTITVTKKGS